MARHHGHLIDIAGRTVRSRDRRTHYRLDRLRLSGETLYFGAHWEGHPRIDYLESWLIPAQGWVVTRFTTRPGTKPPDDDWYIDIDSIEVAGDTWRTSDCFLDVGIHEGQGYVVMDADELADGIEQGEIDVAEAVTALRSLDGVCKALARLGFSGAALLDEYAPGLPH